MEMLYVFFMFVMIINYGSFFVIKYLFRSFVLFIFSHCEKKMTKYKRRDDGSLIDVGFSPRQDRKHCNKRNDCFYLSFLSAKYHGKIQKERNGGFLINDGLFLRKYRKYCKIKM